MKKDEIVMLLQNSLTEKINLNEVQTLKTLIELIDYEEQDIRVKALELIFSAPLFPAEELFQKYLDNRDEFLKKEIRKTLEKFVAILPDYLISKNYFDATLELISEIRAERIYSALKKAYDVIPSSAVLCEIAIRTCHPSFSNYEKSIISFDIVDENRKKIKEILKFRLNQNESVYVELVLRTVLQFPELIQLIVNEIKDIVINSKSETHVSLAAYAIMQLQDKKHTDCLITRLEKEEDSDNVKLSIIEALGNIGDKRAAKILLRELERPAKSEKIGYYTAQSLALLGEEIIPFLIKNLDRDELLPFILEALKRLGEKSYDYLIRALEKEKKSIRKNAAQCLTLIMSEKHGYEGAIEVLVQKLVGKQDIVVSAVTEALLALGTPAIKILIDKLRSKDTHLRKNALNVLKHFGLPNIEIALDDELETNEKEAVKTAVILYIYYHDKDVEAVAREFALKNDKLKVKSDEIFNICLEATTDFDSLVRAKSCDILQHFGAKAVPYLTKLMSDHNINVRRKAVSSLQKIKSKRALIKLLEAAKDKDVIIAEIATRTLGELGDLGATDIIINNLKHTNPILRNASIYALSQLGPKTVPKLSPLLNQESMHNHIATIIVQLGKPALELLLEDLKKAKKTWLKGVKLIVSKMGKESHDILNKAYTTAKTPEEKAKLLLLTAYAGDVSNIKELIELLLTDYNSYAIEGLNLLGPQIAETWVTIVKSLPSQKRKIITNRTKRLKKEIIGAIIEKIKEEEELKKIREQLEKVYTKLSNN